MTTTREEEIDWQHVAKHGLAKVTPEHTWAEWLADRNAEIERLEAEITRLRSTSQAGGVPEGWTRNSLVNAYLAGYWFAALLVRFKDGVGTDKDAYEYLNSFVSGAGLQNGMTVEQHAGEFADKALSAAPTPPVATDGMREALEETLENLELYATPGIANGWVCVPECEWANVFREARAALASAPTTAPTDAVAVEREAIYRLIDGGDLDPEPNPATSREYLNGWFAAAKTFASAIRARGTTGER